MKKGLLSAVILTMLTSSTVFAAALPASGSAVSSYLRGILYLADGRYPQALRELERVKTQDPSSAYLRLKIAFTFLKLGREEEAEAEFKATKALDENNLEASVALILLYASKKDEKALEQEYQYFLERAHQLRPENIKISEYLGQFYFYKKMPEQAIKIYETIIRQQPDYSDGFFWLGYFYEETRQRKKAIKMWKKTIELNPMHADALNSLGYVYAEEGTNLDEAEQMVKKALSQDPNNGAYLDSLGWIYYQKKEYTKSEDYLLEALTNLEEAVVYEHAGDLFAARGDREKALEYYQKGLAREPGNQSLQDKVRQYEQKNTGSKEKSE